jgi:uroporphyrinogen-III decarboxylase
MAGEVVEPAAVTPHWWGVYKFQLAGIVQKQEDESLGWALRGKALADVDSLFYETFQPDMLHLSSGAWKPQPGDVERRRARQELRPQVMRLESKRVIDEYVKAVTPTPKEIASSGIYDHVPFLVERHGESALVLMNEGNPVCEVFDNGGPAGDFEDALAATIEHPDNLAYLLYRLYEVSLDKMRLLKALGAHGYIGSETCVAADILAPKTFRSLVLPALTMFYHEIERMGLVAVSYFLGDVNPILDDIAGMGARALMVEETKKAFELDVVEIQRRLNGRMAVFGNLDSVYGLLWGKREMIEQETRRQCACARKGGFIMACGSPLCLDTPRENIDLFLKVAREPILG